MPSIVFDEILTDSGTASLGSSRVFYVAWEVTNLGPRARHPSFWDTDQYVGVGHFELGNDLTPGGIITGVGWSAPHWFNTLIGQWIAPPGEVGSDFSAAIAEVIRWSLVPGAEVHLYVLG